MLNYLFLVLTETIHVQFCDSHFTFEGSRNRITAVFLPSSLSVSWQPGWLVVARCQIKVARWMFQDFAAEALQQLSSRLGTVRPSFVMLKQTVFGKQLGAFSFSGSS
jgi:hypothetical protein